MKPHQRQYEVNGKSVDIETFRNMILDILDSESLTIPEIANKLKADARKVQYVVYNLNTQGIIDAETTTSRFHIYSKIKVPMLQDIFHPMPDFSGRILSVYQHTEEEANARGQTKANS
jgi:predicted transcriptional regulator